MSEILYIQTEKNVEVYQPEVYLQDVAKLACGDSKVLNRNKIRKVFSIPMKSRAVCDFRGRPGLRSGKSGTKRRRDSYWRSGFYCNL